MNLTPSEKKILLHIARRSLEMLDSTREECEDFLQGIQATPVLRADAGVFVSLHRSDGRLRGCIGCLEGREPLARAVFENARAAAVRDQRFPPVEEDEVPHLEIEISVLSEMLTVQDPSEIQVGRDGVVIRQGNQRGVLLPQVASSMGWRREEFLDGVCRKAGLRQGAWKQGADLQRFEAVVFSEADFGIQDDLSGSSSA